MPFLQTPQRLGFVEAGLLKSAGVVEVVVVVVVVVELELVEGVEVSVKGSGTLGFGHVTSFASSGQNSLIFWNKYHWRVGESPEGVRRSGRTVAVGDDSCFSRLNSSSGASDLTHVKTSHHKQIQLIMAHLSEGGSEGLIVLYWEEHRTWCLLGSKVTSTTPLTKSLTRSLSLSSNSLIAAVTLHTSDRAPLTMLAETVCSCQGNLFFMVTVDWLSLPVIFNRPQIITII